MRRTLLDELLGAEAASPALRALATLARAGALRRDAAALAEEELQEGLWVGSAAAEERPLARLAADTGERAPLFGEAPVPGAPEFRVQARLDPAGRQGWVAALSLTGPEDQDPPLLRVSLMGAEGAILEIELGPERAVEAWIGEELVIAPTLRAERIY